MLVEDDLVDVMSVERAFRELEINNPLYTVGNGEEALESLRDESNPLPGIILLDLNMPRLNGVELLGFLKSDERLRRIPVVILTTSKEATDRSKTFDLGIAGYMVKPVDYPGFLDVMRIIWRYWEQSEIPP
jgi:CheY-like chemotaxis protein